MLSWISIAIWLLCISKSAILFEHFIICGSAVSFALSALSCSAFFSAISGSKVLTFPLSGFCALECAVKINPFHVSIWIGSEICLFSLADVGQSLPRIFVELNKERVSDI